MAKITRKKIFQQLLADLIGKDSHRGVTLTYSWFANQFGHFSLGFIPTLLFFSFLVNDFFDLPPVFFAPISVSLAWLLFELYNFLGPLLRKRKSITKVIWVPGKAEYKFEPAWGNIAFDTFTDLCFFWIGAFSASIFIESTPTAKITLLILLLVVLYPAYYWFLTKMYLQNAFYPLQYRLSQWDFGITKTNKETVLNFLKKKDEGNHLMICGGKGKGKTSLSIGIATEYSISHKSSIYTTASKLYGLFRESDQPITDDTLAWTWQNSSFLVIDDINPGPPIDEIISAEKFLAYLDCTPELSRINRDILRTKNVIWVLGADNAPDANTINSWKNMLTEIGVSDEKVDIIMI